MDGLGDVEALGARVEARDEVRADQIGDVGDNPVVAGLDRLVGPQLVDAAPDDGHLRTDAVQQLPQRAGVTKLSVSAAR